MFSSAKKLGLAIKGDAHALVAFRGESSKDIGTFLGICGRCLFLMVVEVIRDFTMLKEKFTLWCDVQIELTNEKGRNSKKFDSNPVASCESMWRGNLIHFPCRGE